LELAIVFFIKATYRFQILRVFIEGRINPKLFTALRRERRSWATSGVIVGEMILNTNKAVNYE
jgi:hypothetical protein